MLLVAFLRWWYGPGWRDTASALSERMHHTMMAWSMPILVRTMFAPWRRIITASTGSLDQKLRALVDNLVSRLVGFMVRLAALMAACAMLTCYAVLGGLVLILWPVLPILGPVLIVAGLL